MHTTQATLIARIKDPGDQQAWEEFHNIYYDLIMSYARARGLCNTDAAEIADDCMHTLLRKIGEFRYDRHKAKFRTWLRLIVNNRISNLQRKRRPVPATEQVIDKLVDPGPTPDEVWEAQWEDAHVLYCLSKVKSEVSSKQFEAFRLYALEETPVEQVMTQLNMTANQVHTAKSRLMKRLRQEIESILQRNHLSDLLPP